MDPFDVHTGGRPAELLQLVREARKLIHEAGSGQEPACPKCQATTPLQAVFCVACGTRLRLPCPGCETTCWAGLDYCGACGFHLTQEAVGDAVQALAEEAEAARKKREADLLNAYEKTTVLEDGRVQHLLGVRKDDGRKQFVKVARSKAGRRLLLNELAALTAIGPHPGVIALEQHRDQETELVAVFEHVPSQPLRFPLAIPRLLEIVSGVLRTLEHAHAAGIVHADLKPAHVLLREGADPVLIDWNIAQTPGPSKFQAFTPMFAAPEQVFGDRIDPRADLYAVGTILYLLFTHDRFPAVLEERSEPAPMLEVLQAKKVMNRAYLSSGTFYKGKLKSLQQQVQNVAGLDGGDGGGGLEERRVLGAKYLFSSELSRTQDVNAEIRLTGDILKVVQRATAVDPDDRFPDAQAMRAAVDAVLARVEEGGAGAA